MEFKRKNSFESYSNLIAKIPGRKLADLISVNSLEAHLNLSLRPISTKPLG